MMDCRDEQKGCQGWRRGGRKKGRDRKKTETGRERIGERGSRRSQGGLTVIYVAVGSLASCLIKVVSPDRGRAAKLLTRKFSRQSPRLPPYSALVFIPFPATRITLRQTSACSRRTANRSYQNHRDVFGIDVDRSMNSTDNLSNKTEAERWRKICRIAANWALIYG